jgi:hypothetical protein
MHVAFLSSCINLMFHFDYCWKLDETDLRNVDDYGLDALLDGLLVRIVESLGHVSQSSQELAKELNNPDKSGFTLLHYVRAFLS